MVVEASSFQLDKIINLKFNVSILLNLSQDHLDWHKDWNQYLESKLKIFKNQDEKCFAIICTDDKDCEKIASDFNKKFKSKLVPISTKRRLSDGIFIKESKEKLIIINNLNKTKIFLQKEKLNFMVAQHNLQNFLACYTTFFLLNYNNDSFIQSAYQLKSLEHRLELVTKVKNISIFNDSKSTNINSAKNAIKSLDNIYWILGGRKKEGGIKGIESYLKKIVRAYTFGETSIEFNDFLKKRKTRSFQFSNLESALESALKDSLKEKKKRN